LLPFEEFPSLELTTPLRDNGHYAASMMNSDHIKKIFKEY